jgi:hypothetical protein
MSEERAVDKTQVLAERRLRMERDGVAGLQEVALQIGLPQWGKGGDDAICPIAIKGLYDDLPPARGRDFFEALINAARTLRQHCRKLPEGVQLFRFDEPSEDREPYRGEPLSPEEKAVEQKAWEDRHRTDWEVLVERKILMQENGSDERREVVLQIGHPYWMAGIETAACPVVLKGASEIGDDEIEHEYGQDLFAALANAVDYSNRRFARMQCGRFFFWPDGEPYGGDHPDDPKPSYQRDPRSISGNWEVIAERTLLRERDGNPKRRRIVIRIGRPYWRKEGEMATCPMELAGIFKDAHRSYGEDFYAALISALEFFEDYFLHRDSDTQYFWPDGTPYEGEPLYREPGV